MADFRNGPGWWRPVLRIMVQAQPRLMVLGALLAVTTVAAGVGLLGLSGWFIAATAVAGLHITTALVFDVFMPSAGIRLLALGRTAARYGERLLTHDATLATLAQLRERLFLGWAIRAPADFLRRPAQALFRLTSDLDSLESISLRLLVPAVAAAGVALLCTLVFGLITPWFGLLAGAWLLLAGLGVSLVLAWRARAVMVYHSLALERLRTRTIDLVSGQTDLIMSRRLQNQRYRLDRDDARISRADRRLNRLELGAEAAHALASGLTLALALLGAGFLVESGQIATPGAVLIILMALGAMEPFGALRRGALEAGRTWLSARRLAQPLSAAPEPAAIRQLPPAGLSLQLIQVSAGYPDSPVAVLHRLTLAIAKGERVAVVGPSGSGKSSLISVVTTELAASSGEILAQPFAWLSQRTDLFQDTVRENLLLAAPDADDFRLWQALEVAGLATDIAAMPGKLDAWLGEGGVGLSGGQGRRLALARLLLQDQPLWLLDEPTDGLDADTAAHVLAQLDRQATAAGVSWLLATHLRREAVLADRVFVLHDGKFTAQWSKGSEGFNQALAQLRPD